MREEAHTVHFIRMYSLCALLSCARGGRGGELIRWQVERDTLDSFLVVVVGEVVEEDRCMFFYTEKCSSCCWIDIGVCDETVSAIGVG